MKEMRADDKGALNARRLPVLYTFRRCPYAMRARMALVVAGITVEMREVMLCSKPEHLIRISPKATVPVLQLPDGGVIEESLEIMLWALSRDDPENWLGDDPFLLAAMESEINDVERAFKPHLDGYKYHDGMADDAALAHREAGLQWLRRWNAWLGEHDFLFGAHQHLADIAIFPFVRQFAAVDHAWFDTLPLNALHSWLRFHGESPLFRHIMGKQAPWMPDAPQIQLPV